MKIHSFIKDASVMRENERAAQYVAPKTTVKEEVKDATSRDDSTKSQEETGTSKKEEKVGSKAGPKKAS